MNLDAMSREELWALYKRLSQHPVLEARKRFPDRRQGYVSAARNLMHYAANRATAIKLRLAGKITDARRYEAICERLYNELPEFAQW